MDNDSEERRQYLQALQTQVVDVCKELLTENVGIISGLRKLTELHYQLFSKIDDGFLPIINFEEQTDDLPIGNQRKYYDDKFLVEADKQIAEFENGAKLEVFEICQKLIKRFSVQ